MPNTLRSLDRRLSSPSSCNRTTSQSTWSPAGRSGSTETSCRFLRSGQPDSLRRNASIGVQGQLGQVKKQGGTPTNLNLTESKRREMGYSITDRPFELPAPTRVTQPSRIERLNPLRGRSTTLWSSFFFEPQKMRKRRLFNVRPSGHPFHPIIRTRSRVRMRCRGYTRVETALFGERLCKMGQSEVDSAP